MYRLLIKQHMKSPILLSINAIPSLTETHRKWYSFFQHLGLDKRGGTEEGREVGRLGFP